MQGEIFKKEIGFELDCERLTGKGRGGNVKLGVEIGLGEYYMQRNGSQIALHGLQCPADLARGIAAASGR